MESWKYIPGTDKNYRINSSGKVEKKCKGANQFKEVVPYLDSLGYQVIYVRYEDGSRKRRLIHRLVAQSFCNWYYDGVKVYHWDGDSTNNSYTNLTSMAPIKADSMAMLDKKELPIIDLTTGIEYPSCADAESYLNIKGVLRSIMRRCKCAGHEFAFVDLDKYCKLGEKNDGDIR